MGSSHSHVTYHEWSPVSCGILMKSMQENGGKVVATDMKRLLPGRTLKSCQQKATALRKGKQLASKAKDEKRLEEVILKELVEKTPPVTFDDIVGQHAAKQALQEIVILPALRPELFTGLRTPARGLLLFGPPGNGKTLLAKAIANVSSAKFINVSAATITSKWYGEAEKLVKALFAVARELQPTIIFIDEIDSLLCERRGTDNDSGRRLKTQFLVECDGVLGCSDDRVLLMGATNRPFDLDDAVIRRIMVKMPDLGTRQELLRKLLSQHNCPLTTPDLNLIASKTEGFSLSDLTSLAKDAAMGPVREIDHVDFATIPTNMVRNINVGDFIKAMKTIKRSVPVEVLDRLATWDKEYGA